MKKHLHAATNIRATFESDAAHDDLAAHDEVVIRLPDGRTVCVSILETPDLGVWGYVYVHAADATITDLLTF